MGVSLYDVQRADGTALGVVGRDVVWSLESGGAPRIRRGDESDQAHDGRELVVGAYLGHDVLVPRRDAERRDRR